MGLRWELALVSVALGIGSACAAAAGSSPAISGEQVATPSGASGAAAGAQAAGKAGVAVAGSAASNTPTRSAARGGSEARAGDMATAATTAGVTAAVAGSGGLESAAAGGGGTADSAGAPAADGCSRALLESTLDSYFVALAAHQPAMLPLVDHVKLTENGKTIELGKAGLWTSAGAQQHVHSAFDVDQCTAVAQAVVPDGKTPIPVALRLKLEKQKIIEIEMIAVRDGDYMLASNTDALSASALSVHWQDVVPADQRNTRAELAGWMEKYFRLFPRGVCNTTSDCKRIENGGGSFNCSAGASCSANAPGPNDNALTPRLILVDVETGVGVGFTMFQANTDMHMFKMYGGKVYGVSAILAKADSPGW